MIAATSVLVGVIVGVVVGQSPSVPPNQNREIEQNRAPAWHRPELRGQVPTEPRRIVSLAPVVTETLFRLGRGDRVVGVTRFCDRPTEASKLEKVGGYVDISLERVLSLSPDLVIAMPTLGQREVLDRLRERGIPVRVVFADTLTEARGLIRDLGVLVHAPDAAATLDAQIGAGLAQLRELRLPPRRTALIVGLDPVVVAGPGTFAADVLQAAGLASASPVDAPKWPVWSVESLVASRVDVLVAAEGPESARKLSALLERSLPAPRRPLVLAAPRAILMRPGPALVEDLPELTRLLRALTAPPAPRELP